MALRFISHKEIAFRNLLGMLRTPPIAVMNYYTNVFMSARFVFGDQPVKIRFLEKEIRRVESLVGVEQTWDSNQIWDEFTQINTERKTIEYDMRRVESMFDSATKEEQEDIIKLHQELTEKIRKLNGKEHYLLFKIQPLMDLKQIETYMDNNMNLKSFFKEHGKKVTQMELNSELEKIKIWVYQEAVQLMPYIRFTKLE
jgi:hypothetical protein